MKKFAFALAVAALPVAVLAADPMTTPAAGAAPAPGAAAAPSAAPTMAAAPSATTTTTITAPAAAPAAGAKEEVVALKDGSTVTVKDGVVSKGGKPVGVGTWIKVDGSTVVTDKDSKIVLKK